MVNERRGEREREAENNETQEKVEQR